MSLYYYQWREKIRAVPSKHSIKIISSNDCFSSYFAVLDKLINERIVKFDNVSDLYTAKLVKIDKENRRIETDDKTGTRTTSHFKYVYIYVPTWPNDMLVNTGIAALKNRQISVEFMSLCHITFDIIY